MKPATRPAAPAPRAKSVLPPPPPRPSLSSGAHNGGRSLKELASTVARLQASIAPPALHDDMYLQAALLRSQRPSGAPVSSDPRRIAVRRRRTWQTPMFAGLALFVGVAVTSVAFHWSQRASAESAQRITRGAALVTVQASQPAQPGPIARALAAPATDNPAAGPAPTVIDPPRLDRASGTPPVAMAPAPSGVAAGTGSIKSDSAGPIGSVFPDVAGDSAAQAAPEAAAPPFDKELAKKALAEAAAQAASCGDGKLNESARVAITFAPSGRATVAVVEGASSIKGSAVGSCVAAKMRQARLPAFSGEFVTVRTSVTVY